MSGHLQLSKMLTTMTLTLRAVSLNDHPLTQPITVHFDAQGGSIGRADHNTMALPDPERHISRQQAEVISADRSFTIRNVGSANPIVVGTRTLARGESAALAQGDRLRIGGYLLEVEVEEGDSAEAATITRGRAAVDAATPPGRRAVREPPADAGPAPAADFGGFGADPALPLAPGNPFADLFGNAAPPRAGVDTPAPGPVGGSRLPDDFDPFAAPPPPAPPPAPAIDRPGGVFGDLIPNVEPASIDKLFGLGRSDGRDPLGDFMADAGTPANGPARGPARGSTEPPLPTDPLALFGFAQGRASGGAARTGSDHVPELQAAYAPPRLAPEPPPPDPPHDRTAPPDAASWAAFCEGAGIALPRRDRLDAETMRQIGALLRSAVDGTLRLMAVRASAKHELRAPVTVIQSQHNNPLKFSPDVGAALEQLLQPPLRGFLPGPAALDDAMDDLVGHAIGTLAGTRAALEGVLDRFAPGQLESKLTGRSMLDSVLPMNRKARLWALYLQHFETIRGEAQEDFHSLFGRAFLAAYQQQLERLHAAAPRDP